MRKKPPRFVIGNGNGICAALSLQPPIARDRTRRDGGFEREGGRETRYNFECGEQFVRRRRLVTPRAVYMTTSPVKLYTHIESNVLTRRTPFSIFLSAFSILC